VKQYIIIRCHIILSCTRTPYVYACVCVCVYGCMYVYIYIYIYMCVCVCVYTYQVRDVGQGKAGGVPEFVAEVSVADQALDVQVHVAAL
jgi:hypothetical protein